MSQPGRQRPEPARISPELFRTQPENKYLLTAETKQTVRQLARPSARSGRLSPLGYNLTVSHERRFMWFRVAKVATRSLFGHFATHGVHLGVEHAMRLRYPVEAFEEYFKFAFVRHPVDRFVSAWRNKVVDHNYFEFDDDTRARMQQVEEFAHWTARQDLADLSATDHHLALQTRLVDLTQVDHLGRLETFDADFAEVCERIGLPVSPADVRNRTSTPGPSGPPPSEELKALVAQMYRRDFQVFGY